MARVDATNTPRDTERLGAGRVHPLSVSKVVNASEDAPRARQVRGGVAPEPHRWKSLLTIDLFVWLQTLKDRRFYQKMELDFAHIDQYFRERGFQYSRGMSLKPSRRVLSRFSALSGIFHPREKIHVVAPGDPIFSLSGDGTASHALDSRGAHTSRQNLASQSSSPDFGDSVVSGIKQPRLIVTSLRLLVFHEDHWVSHFYADMVDELPAILSWSERRGWHRALDNDHAQYYRRVRYISADRKRKSIPCTDTNTAALISWLVQLVGERTAQLRSLKRSYFPFPWARSYLERDIAAQHLKVIDGLGDSHTKKLAELAVARPPHPEPRIKKVAPAA